MKSILKDQCSKEWLEFIEFHQRAFQFKAQEWILRQGEPMTGIYSIVEGKVKVTANDLGEERLVRLASVGDVVGHRGLGGPQIYPVSAVALVPTTVHFLPLHAFEVVAKTNANFSYQLMIFLAEELRGSEENHLLLPVLNRVARTTMMNYRAFGFSENSTMLSYTISRRDIASHASTTYESVIRALADLAKHKVIKLVGKSISILDLERLERLGSSTEEL